MAPVTNEIPEELRKLAQWVVFRLEPNEDGKPTKRPYQPKSTRNLASSTNRATWGTYEQALEAIERDSSLSGVGFVFTLADPYAGIDLDHCIVDGKITKAAQTIIDQMRSYSEYSPSGDGVHIIVKATVPKGRKNTKLEMYSSGRYFTMTGKRIGAQNIYERQEEVDALYAQHFGEQEEERQPVEVKPVPLDDQKLLDTAFSWPSIGSKLRSLYIDGDLREYKGDESSADLALANYLAFLCGRDMARMDRLFRASALYRKKWDERRGEHTYGYLTLQKAIDNCRETYSPGVQSDGFKFERVVHLDPETGELLDFSVGRQLIGDAMRHGVQTAEWLLEPVLVRGKIHLIYGEPESGKTIISLSWLKHVIESGMDVLFVDEESGIASIAKLLSDMGVDPDLVDQHVYYFPFPGVDSSQYALLLQYADQLRPAYCLFDSLTDMLSVAGLDENSGIQVTSWMLDIAQSLARRDYAPAVVLVDHVTKDTSNVKYSVASRAKKAKSDVLWLVERDADFDKEKTAHVTLWRHKNRPGNLPKQVVYLVGGENGRLICEVYDKDEHGAVAVPDQSERLYQWITEMGGSIKPFEAMQNFDTTNERTVRRWAKELEDEGRLVKEGEAKTARWRVI